LDDPQIYAAFAAYGLTQYGPPAGNNTESIDAWLSTDCKSTPSYLDWLHTTGQTK